MVEWRITLKLEDQLLFVLAFGQRREVPNGTDLDCDAPNANVHSLSSNARASLRSLVSNPWVNQESRGNRIDFASAALLFLAVQFAKLMAARSSSDLLLPAAAQSIASRNRLRASSEVSS